MQLEYYNLLDESGRLSPHFSVSEILKESTYNVNDKYGPPKIAKSVLEIAELVREFSGGEPVSINSAFRNFVPIGGSKNSAHMRGNALDIGLNKKQIKTLKSNLAAFMTKAQFDYGLRGFAGYSWGVHVDVDQDLPIVNTYEADNTATGGGTWYGKIRHWNAPLWLKKNVEHDQHKTGDSVGHNDEVVKEKAKTVFVWLLPLSLIAAYFIYKRFKK